MASSSSSNNPSKESDNQEDNKSNQLSETFIESKKILPTSLSNVEETIEERSVKIVRRHAKAQQDDLSPYLIEKQHYAPLTAPFLSATSTYPTTSSSRIQDPVIRARPFEEIFMGQPNIDGPTKPDDSKLA